MVEPAALVGQTVDGRWHLVHHLGSGQFGEVYAAEPRHLELSAGAVKIVRPQTDTERHQILNEIHALAELNHDGLLGYRDSGEIHEGVMAGGIYIVTELCDATLADEDGWGVASQDFQVRLAAAIRQVAAALSYLHERGLIHRDVKPANILRAGETWKLSDFGLLQSLADGPGSGGVEGTAPYLAPETTSDDGAGTPADIYALGVVVHQGLTGVWPYDQPYGRWSRPPLEQGAEIMISPVLPDGWRPLVEACLATDPKRRPRATEVAPLVPGGPAGEPPPSPVGRVSTTERIDTLPPDHSPDRRVGLFAALAGAVVLALVIAAVVFVRTGSDDGIRDSAGEGSDAASTSPDAPITSAATDTATESDPDEEADSDGDLEPSVPPRSNFVDENGVLNVFGSTRLDGDLSTPVSIRADHVDFDCNGHTISGPGTLDASVNDGQGISVRSRFDTRIANCVVTDFYTGIFIGNDSDVVEIVDNELVGNGEGIRIDRSLGATVNSNRADGNDSWGFILTDGTTNVLLEDNTAEANGMIGFALNNVSDNELRANRATVNPTNFSITGSDRNLLVSNLAEGAGEGFFIAGSDANGFENNIASGAGGPSGFALDNADDNRLVGNTATGYGQGFTSYLGSAGNTFESNTAADNHDGIADQSTLGDGTAGTDSVYVDNTCTGNVVASNPEGLC